GAREQTYLRLGPDKAPEPVPKVKMGLADEVGFPHVGQVDFIDNRLNPQTGAIRMRATFDNSKGKFTPGLAVRLSMEGTSAYDAVLVPERATGTDQTKNFVYVAAAAGGPAQSRDVKPGALTDGMRVVS